MCGLAVAGCGQANLGAQQVPAQVAGTVVTPTGAPAPDAVVRASGKDGVHVVDADGAGHFDVALLLGHWVLSAAAGPTGPAGPPVVLDVTAGGSVRVTLRVP